MSELKVIHSQNVLDKQFEIYGTKENPLFLAKDVANWIEHKNPSQMSGMVDNEEKGIHIVNTFQGLQSLLFLTEDGLYEVLMQSRKPIAKQFKKQIKSILKQIRETGGYIPVKEEETNEEFLARAFMIAQDTLAKKDVLLAEKEKQLIDQQPAVEFSNAVQSSKDTITIHEFALAAAKTTGIGRNKLLEILRKNKIFQNKNQHGKDFHNIPYQKFVDLKYFEIEEKVVFNKWTEEQQLNLTAKITPKGQIWLIKKINQHLEENEN